MKIEAHAKRYGNLHPAIREALQGYFKIRLDTVEVKLVTFAPISTIWTLADVVVAKYGTLNFELIREEHEKDGKRWTTTNRTVDLSTISGVRILAHELKHCEQWRLTPRWKYLLWYLPSLFKSYWTEKRYAHKFFRWEQEAIAFDKTIEISEMDKALFLKMRQ